MFTGIITAIGEVVAVEPRGDLHRLRVASSYDATSLDLGASIAHAGVCLTVVDRAPGWHEVDVAAETLAVTTARGWGVGTKLNLERALKIGDELGGHIVTGHVDGVARLLSRDDFEGMARFWFEAPEPLAKFIATKGSVALDGTSLTVNEVENSRFCVLLIPHTLAVTTWGARQPGDGINLEVDLMARYAARLSGY